jgi:hypothetical protein
VQTKEISLGGPPLIYLTHPKKGPVRQSSGLTMNLRNLISKIRTFPYWQLLAIPALLFAIGFTCNMTALISNGGRMPVLVTKGEIFEGAKPDYAKEVFYDGIEFIDPIHTVMRKEDHVKFLCDIFNLHDGTYSIGDFFAISADWLWDKFSIAWLALVIRKFFS